LPNSPTNRSGAKKKIHAKAYPQILTNLETLADQLRSAKPDKEYVEFVEAYRRHTNDLSQRAVRHEFLWKCVKEALG
jgi:hypothetical protein